MHTAPYTIIYTIQIIIHSEEPIQNLKSFGIGWLKFILMTVNGFSSRPSKKRRLDFDESLEAEATKAKLAAVKENVGRHILVFETSGPTPSSSQAFTGRDVKTRKVHEAQDAARRLRSTKATIRVRFPDDHTLEVAFHSSEKIQSLMDLLAKVVAHPELPFYIFTTPPKEQVKDFSQDFYAAGFVPGAIVYFSYDGQTGDGSGAVDSCTFLREEILYLKYLSS